MTGRARVLLVTFAVFAGGGWLASGPAVARADEVAGAAFAVSITSGSASILAASPAGVDGSGAARFPPVAASAPLLAAPGLVSVAQLAASTDGTPGPGGPAAVTSASSRASSWRPGAGRPGPPCSP